MPLYNGADKLEAALDSIVSQTHTDFELVICDNDSQDESEKICREYADADSRVVYVRNSRNLGAATNFNLTFELSRSEYFKWAAHDDLLKPTYLERCIETFDQSPPSVVLVFPRRELISYEGEYLGPDPAVRWRQAGPPFDRVSFAAINRIPDGLFPTLVFGLCRRDALRKTRLIGPFAYADLVLVGELRLQGEFREVPERLFQSREHLITKEFIATRKTIGGEAEWYDPNAYKKRLKPNITVLLERLESVRISDLRLDQKIFCYGVVVFGFMLMRVPFMIGRWSNWYLFVGRMWRLWDRWTLSGVQRNGRFQITSRVWCLASGFRRGIFSRIILALSFPSRKVRSALADFAATKLVERNDPDARNVLEKWAHGANDELRHAAASAGVTAPKNDDVEPLELSGSDTANISQSATVRSTPSQESS